MDKKKIISIVAIAIILIVAVVLETVFIPLEEKETYEGTRKAFIVCSANDFYESTPEDEFNGKNDATFEYNEGNWTFIPDFNCTGDMNQIFLI